MKDPIDWPMLWYRCRDNVELQLAGERARASVERVIAAALRWEAEPADDGAREAVLLEAAILRRRRELMERLAAEAWALQWRAPVPDAPDDGG